MHFALSGVIDPRQRGSPFDATQGQWGFLCCEFECAGTSDSCFRGNVLLQVRSREPLLGQTRCCQIHGGAVCGDQNFMCDVIAIVKQ